MASKMIFIANKQAAVYNRPDPSSTIIGMVAKGRAVLITRIFDYNTITKTYKEVGENETVETDTVIKMLYNEDVGGYTRKSDLDYNANYSTAKSMNKVVITQTPIILRVAPTETAETTGTVISGTSVRIKLESVNGYYYIQFGSGVSGWVNKNQLPLIENNIDNTNSPERININDSQVTVPQQTGTRTEKNSVLFDPDGDDLKKLLNSNSIYDRKQLEIYDKFNRFGYLNPYTNITTTKEYLFFTKPDLHIFESGNSDKLNKELASYPIFDDAIKRYKPVLTQLQMSIKNNKNPFMNILSNTVKNALDLPSISANEIETSANIYGTRLKYRTTSYASDDDFDFSLTFEDTKYLEVYMLFKIFDEYERKKYIGEITPPDMLYRYRKRLHDQISIYKFIVGEDGETLIYWAKLYGCYPKGVPRDTLGNLSESNGDGLKLDIQWHAQFVDDMDPQILTDFNYLVKNLYNNSYKTDLPLYDKEIEGSNGEWAGIPYIAIPVIKNNPLEPKEMQHKYLLKWRA